MQRSPEGTPVYSEIDVAHVMPLLFLAVVQGVGLKNAPPAILAYLERFAVEIGFKAGGNTAAFQQALDAHYAARPANPHLLRAFRRLHSEIMSGRVDLTAAKAFAKFLGTPPQRAQASSTSESDGDTIKGGPMTAFLLRHSALTKDD